jgi:hypothetical protein
MSSTAMGCAGGSPLTTALRFVMHASAARVCEEGGA